MKPLKGNGGYTIIEVMIFLAVSSLMFASVVGLLSTQNRRNQFTESVNTFNQRLQDMLNDVDTGYFPTSGNDFTCTLNASGIPIQGAGTAQQGKNKDCVFAGKSLARNASNPEQFDVQTLVGRRTLTVSGVERDVTSIAEANITPLTWSSASSADSGSLSAGVQITKIRSFNDNSFTFASDVDRVAIVTGFGQSAGAGKSGLKSGTIKSQLAVLRAGSWQLAPNGVVMCFAEDGNTTTGRKATIRIGAGSSQESSIVVIDDNNYSVVCGS